MRYPHSFDTCLRVLIYVPAILDNQSSGEKEHGAVPLAVDRVVAWPTVSCET